MASISDHTALVRQFAARLGFDHCGIARAKRLDVDAEKLETWLSKGLHGSMKYMENHFELRVDPTKLVPGARSVITLLLNYFPESEQKSPDYKISKYAYGQDYHLVIRKKLNDLLDLIRQQIGDVNGRGFVDSAPVLERAWARESGAGWIGKNGNLITKGGGSYFFIATLITDLPLQYDDPFVKDFCGSCTKCIDACPTDAIKPNRVVEGNRCISYFTIELKELLIPTELAGKFDNWVFGCDICQEVCPWNRFASPTTEPELKPLPDVLNLSTSEWESLTEDTFKRIFKHSAVKRSKFKGLQRNLAFVSGKEPPTVKNSPPDSSGVDFSEETS